MGFEFRRFKPLTSEEFEQAYSNLSNTTSSNSQVKNDTYLMIVDRETGKNVLPESIGIKLAHQSQLEIKIRTKRKKSGIEKWKKIQCFERVDLSSDKLLLECIQKQLQALMNDILVDDSAEIPLLRTEFHQIISAQTCKIRKNSKLSTFSPFSQYEIAFFTLKFENDDEILYFKSVNIEGEKKFKKIDKKIVEKDLLLSSQDDQVITCGYPELLLRKYLEMKANHQQH